MIVPLASLWLALAPPDSTEGPATDQPAESAEADLSEAKRLFDEGTARYDAADFDGAIETWTLALSELRKQGVSGFRIRGLLMFNIGQAHMRAYGIDEGVEHLRQAKSIFNTFITESEQHPDEVDAGDIEEARTQLVEIDRLLAAANEPEPEPTGKRDRNRDRPEPKGDPKKLRASGIGLLAGGGALFVAGFGVLAFGASFGPHAQAQVDQLDGLGLPADSPAFADGQAFIDDERRKGTTWMAVGGVSVGLGVVAIAVGVRQYVTAKRIEASNKKAGVSALTPTAAIGRDAAVFGVSGRF